MIAFETGILIDRPIDEVFAYVSDLLNFPSWNSAVRAVCKTSAGENGGAATYTMERELASGRVVDELAVLASERPSEFAIRVTGGPTPFRYRYRFFEEKGETVLKLDAQVELPRPYTLLPQLARRLVRSGVDDNLASLKLTLEAARR
jgi:Polyketide cyclase / dehydrase and lipid transport